MARVTSRIRYGVFAVMLWCGMPASADRADPGDKAMVERGAMIYRKFCAVCHGVNLEGQPDWRKRKPDGRLPAPPHDRSGHTWHHPDRVLFEITKYGLVPPHAPENYASDMPAWQGVLSDADIWAVLAYIKSRWPKEVLEVQEGIDRQSREARRNSGSASRD